MDITPVIPKGRQIITGYGTGSFAINGEKWPGSIIIVADRTVSWSLTQAENITIDTVAPFLEAGNVELLLIGTGARWTEVDPALRHALREKGIALEVMDTGAACRTYNVLLAEERRVAAALIAL